MNKPDVENDARFNPSPLDAYERFDTLGAGLADVKRSQPVSYLAAHISVQGVLKYGFPLASGKPASLRWDEAPTLIRGNEANADWLGIGHIHIGREDKVGRLAVFTFGRYIGQGEGRNVVSVQYGRYRQDRRGVQEEVVPNHDLALDDITELRALGNVLVGLETDLAKVREVLARDAAADLGTELPS